MYNKENEDVMMTVMTMTAKLKWTFKIVNIYNLKAHMNKLNKKLLQQKTERLMKLL